MNDQFQAGTFLWGVVLTLAGAALAAVGFGWWELAAFDLRYLGPILVVVAGAVILLGALTSGSRSRSDTDPHV
jgi:membrane protein DedA with SNARE-associated domain